MTENITFTFEDTSVAFAAKSDPELRKTYWLFKSMNYPWLVKSGTQLVKSTLHWGGVRSLIKKTLFAHFCGGEDIQECSLTISKLSKYGIGTILDYAVEGATTEAGYDQTAEEIIRTIQKASVSFDIPFSVFKPTGLAPTWVLEKIQAKQPLTPDEQAAYDRAVARIDRICRTAWEKKVRIFMDAEETWIQEPIDEIAYTMMQRYNQEGVIVYNTYQMYCANKLEELRSAFRRACREQFYLGAKLVRGAYMEKERKRAGDMGYPDPIQPNKEATDRDYNLALKFCIENKQRIALCSGTHNEYSNYYLTVLMNKYNVKPNDANVYFAQLYGMSDHISYNLSREGYNVAKYVPYGPVEAVLPYLFRRAEENTAIAGQSSRELTLVMSELKRRKTA